MDAWYVIYTKARGERTALENLERQGYRAYLPLVRLRRRARGRSSVVVEPLFPRYLFLCLSDSTEDWGPIRSTIGVSRLVRFGTEPARVPDGFVSALRAGDDEQGVQRRALREPEPGERVRIVEGAMAGLDAVFHASGGAERVVVLLEVAQRQVRVELDSGAIDPS